MRRALLALALAAVAGLAAPATSAFPADLDVDVDIGSPGDQFVVKGRVDLGAGQTAKTVVVVDGDVDVARGATVTGDVVSVDGTVRVAGVVRGRVVTVGGRAIVTRTGVVREGIRYGEDEPIIAPGAQVGGRVTQIDLDFGDAVPFISWLALWLAVSISTLMLGVLLLWIAPRAADATFERMRDGGWGPAIGVGFVVFLGLPTLAVMALITLVGIPFGIGLLLALLPLGALGYTAGAWLLGRAVIGPPRGRFAAFLAGWGMLRLAALIPFVGGLVFLAAMIFGLGALAWAMLQARDPGAPAAPAPAGGPESPTAPSI